MSKEIYLDMEFIKFVMEQKGLTAKDMAERMNLTTTATIRKYLNGADQKNLTILLLLRFSRALDLSVSQLLKGEYIIVQK